MNSGEVKELKVMARHQLRLTMVGPYRVSTIDLAAMEGLTANSRAAITKVRVPFETMVFVGEEGDSLDEERYVTREEAMAGHEAMVERWLLAP
jgi:hypothetical protein